MVKLFILLGNYFIPSARYFIFSSNNPKLFIDKFSLKSFMLGDSNLKLSANDFKFYTFTPRLLFYSPSIR